jgi:hypothetical protein
VARELDLTGESRILLDVSIFTDVAGGNALMLTVSERRGGARPEEPEDVDSDRTKGLLLGLA